MGVRVPSSLRRAPAVLPAVLAVGIVALLMAGVAPARELVFSPSLHSTQTLLNAVSAQPGPKTTGGGELLGFSSASGTPGLSSPSAGSLFRTVYPNYNATTSFNFPGTVWDWLVGTPAYVPTTHDLWIPTRAAELRAGPVPQIAPVVIYNETLNEFTGVVPSIQNASALYYDAANGDIYSADYSNATVGVLNATTENWAHPAIPVGTEPAALAFDPSSSRLFVANEGSNNVTGINCTSNTISNPSIPTGAGSEPHALAYDSTDHTLFVADAGDSFVRTINTINNQTRSPVPLTGTPSAVAYSPAVGQVAITVPSTPRLVIIDATTLATVALLPIGRGGAPVTTNATSTEFIVGDANGTNLITVNASSDSVTDSDIPVGDNVTALAPGPAANEIVAWAAGDRNISVVNLSSDTPLTSSPTLGPEPASIAYDSATNRMFVANIFGGRVLVLNATTGLSDSKPWWFGSPASSVAVDPTTNVLYVGAADRVDAVNVSSGSVLFDTTNTTGNTPLALDLVDGLLWLNNGTAGLTALYLTNLTEAYSVPDEWPASPPLLLLQNTMALVPAEHELFFVNETSHEVEAIDITTHQIVDPDISAGPAATSIAFDPADDLLYVLGTNLTVINPQTDASAGLPISLVAHAVPTGIVYDPSRGDLYVATALGSANEWVGTISVIDGSNLTASYGSQVIIPVGEYPTDPLPVMVPGSGAESTSVIWIANLVSGTLSMITSPPAITFLSASPSTIDVGQTTQMLLGFEGGTGAETITYSGLPPGCSSLGVLVLNCTPSATGNYTISAVVTDSFGFTANATTELSVSPGLSVTAALSPGYSSRIDVGQEVSVYALATGGTPGYAYEWNFGDGTTTTGVSANHTYSATGSYLLTITVTDAVRSSVTSTALQIVVDALPNSIISVTPSNETDVEIPLAFSATIHGGTWPGTATWEFGDGNSSTGLSASHAWSHPGVYLVTLHYRDAAGEYANRSETVTVNPQLTATFSAGTSGVSPTTSTWVPFIATISGGSPPYNVTWQFGDSSEGFGASTHHAYALAGNYLINVTVVDAAGGRLTESLPLTVSSSAPTTTSSSNGNLDLGIFFGFLIGVAVALVLLYIAGRSRRRRRPPPSPSPYVPPEPIHPSEPPDWKED